VCSVRSEEAAHLPGVERNGRGLHLRDQLRSLRLSGEACEGVEQGRPIQRPVLAGRAAPVVRALQDPRLVLREPHLQPGPQ
jgi:hypothetical protein